MTRINRNTRLTALALAVAVGVLLLLSSGVFRLEVDASPVGNTADSSVQLSRNGIPMFRKGFTANGEVYVHLYLFMRNFTPATYSVNGGTVTVKGSNLTVSATIGQPYITANERIIYTGLPVISADNALCVPLSALSKALGIKATSLSSASVALTGDYTPILSGNKFYSADRLYWLSKIISAESKGEPLRGQMAVGCVILNREKSPQFPNSIYGVIFDKTNGVQFTPTANGSIYDTPYAMSVIAAKICLEGYNMGNILYFYHPAYSGQTNWISNNRPYAFTISHHQFYY